MKEWMAQADPTTVKNWMAGYYSSRQIKWYTTLKNGWLQVAFWKIDIAFTKSWCY